MCRVASARFDPKLSAPRFARHWIADCLRSWGLPEMVESAELLTSELAANAVLHAGDAPTVSAAVAEGVLEVAVSDNQPRLPRLVSSSQFDPGIEQAVLAETGRGLLLVDALADEWGATSLTTGKQVWFRLAIGEWEHRDSCTCQIDQPGRIGLASGHPAFDMEGKTGT